jgi:hypothetical protein
LYFLLKSTSTMAPPPPPPAQQPKVVHKSPCTIKKDAVAGRKARYEQALL